MNETILDIPIYENPMDEFFDNTYHKHLMQISEAIEMMSIINDNEFILEEVQDTNVSRKDRRDRAKANTKRTTKEVGALYKSTVDAQAKYHILKFDILTKLAGFIAKALESAVTLIDRSIRGCGKLIHDVAEIPQDAFSKISGDITLYITAGDIDMLYNKSVIKKIDSILAYLETLVKGDNWQKRLFLFNLAPEDKEGHKKGIDDFHKLNEVAKLVSNIENIQFNLTTIDMRDKHNVELYLSSTTAITVTDLKGNTFNGTYLQALEMLLDDINKRKDTLIKMREFYGDKYEDTLANSNFANMKYSEQQKVTEGMQNISKAITVTSNIIRCVTADIATISKATVKINDYYRNTRAEKQSKRND